MKVFKLKSVFISFLLALCLVCQPAIAAQKINLNSATIEQLIELKGIGEKTALKIVEYRKTSQFTKIEDLLNVKGIGEKTFKNISSQLTVEQKKK